jgi:hypothetical protein
MHHTVLLWRRTDLPGFERLELCVAAKNITAASTVLSAEAGGLRIDHRWELDAEWRAQSVTIERWGSASHGVLRVQRAGSGWTVDGVLRPDLDGAEEPDLSVTPFCNTFPIRRIGPFPGDNLQLDTAFIDGAALTVRRSSQRYDRQGAGRLRYVDLGLSKGFEADLAVDETGLVLSYEYLFERVSPKL